MRFIITLFITNLIILFSSNSIAGKDPINYSLSGSFHNPAIVGRSYTVTYTFTNQLPVKLVKPLIILKNATPASDFTYDDACSGQRLNPNASCTVQVTLTADTAGTKSVQLIIAGYDDNQVPLPTLTTTAQGVSPSLTQIYSYVTQAFPANLTIGQPASYSFTFTNRGSASVNGVTLQVTQSSGTPSYTTSNCTTTLGAGKSCIVTGSYTPTSASPVSQSVAATFNYSGSKSVSATTSGSVTSTSGVIPSFVNPYYLPAEMVGGPSNTKQIQVSFYNNTGSQITATAMTLAITTGGGSGTFTLDPVGATNNCLNSGGAAKALPNQAACIATGTFEGAVVGSDTQVVITGSLTYTGATGSPVSIATSTFLVPTLGTSRTISLINNCDFPVWFSFHGGALGGSPSCPASACPTGTTCNTATHTCFWTNPGPNSGTSFQLAASGGNNTATIPLNSGTDPAIQWSGVISASLRCDNGLANCIVAPCGNSDGTTSCAPGQGFIGPTTQAEITFNISTSDSYDVEVINGFHIPVAITPGSHTTANNYNCGVAGNFTAENNFGSCNWNNATPPGNGYYIVTSGGNACDITAPSCASDQICGIALDLTSNTLTQSCGAFLGFWTANEICGQNPANGSVIANYFQCYQPLGGNFPAGAVNYDLMKCSVPTGDTTPPFNTCYSPYPSSTANDQALISQCCGCKDWWTAGVGANPNTASCTQSTGYVNTSPQWNQVIQPTVQWLKSACPSAYVYQFDDKTSGFSCSNNLAGQSNSTNYTITFCQGSTGKPTGKLDGRKNPPAQIRA